MASKKIRRKFLNGTRKVFFKLFTDDIIYRPQIDNLKNDTYNEGLNKLYGEPIKLVGKKDLSIPDPINSVELNIIHAEFTFPHKTFMENEINISLTNLPTVAQGIIEYMDKTYIIEKITPKTFVTDVFLFYAFECEEVSNAYD